MVVPSNGVMVAPKILQAAFVRPRDQLAVAGDQVSSTVTASDGGAIEPGCPMSLMPEQHDHVADAGLGEHVAVEARRARCRPNSGPMPANGSCSEACCRRCRRLTTPMPLLSTPRSARRRSCSRRGQQVGPAVVGVDSRDRAVGDRVAERHDRAPPSGRVDARRPVRKYHEVDRRWRRQGRRAPVTLPAQRHVVGLEGRAVRWSRPRCGSGRWRLTARSDRRGRGRAPPGRSAPARPAGMATDERPPNVSRRCRPRDDRRPGGAARVDERDVGVAEHQRRRSRTRWTAAPAATGSAPAACARSGAGSGPRSSAVAEDRRRARAASPPSPTCRSSDGRRRPPAPMRAPRAARRSGTAAAPREQRTRYVPSMTTSRARGPVRGRPSRRTPSHLCRVLSKPSD